MILKGIVKKILNWSAWEPLSRISYSAYLVHFIVIYNFYTNQEHTFHIQDINIVGVFKFELVFKLDLNSFDYFRYICT